VSPVSRKRKKKNDKRGPTPKRHAADFPLDFGFPQPPKVKLPPPGWKPGALRISITLLGSDPLIWRRLEVPARTTLESLHWIIQLAFDWDDSHLHQFEVPSGVVGNEQSAGLPEPGSTLHYVYDFGDDWVHEIKVEELLPEGNSDQVTCIDGASAAPKEDSGGVWGWANMCRILADPEHPEHEDYLEWIDDVPDPHAFDIALVNRRLSGLTSR
jgi:hypothetical protein